MRPRHHNPSNRFHTKVRTRNTPLIHQIWKSTDLSTYPTRAFHDEWKSATEPLNYTVKLWTDEDLLNLLQQRYPWLESTYHGYSHNVQRADLMRLVVVHAEGGVYADLDVFPRSMEELDCLRHLSGAKFAPTAGNRGLSNHMFMAPADHPFIWWALTEAKRRGDVQRRILLPYLRVFWSTGPLMVTAAYSQYVDMFGPPSSPVLLDEGFARTVFGHAAGRSWHGSDGRLLNLVADNFGVGTAFVALGFVTSLLGTILLGKRLRRRYSKQFCHFVIASRQC
ncbi:hypothetical protein B0T11DRAFT_224449 [Plectosphaerella cucumerina]|uniref:Mannosyl phosphorylinositol ceramide synthase SUR1 n=1 Tax=Plectosphaerella cucumerina TaxID=40658 RepID=A0A8K0X4T5_9PEZI|nr:hypothetical protein B0T11DRAFT_224449 [Plectosphaerella cucumerina]